MVSLDPDSISQPITHTSCCFILKNPGESLHTGTMLSPYNNEFLHTKDPQIHSFSKLDDHTAPPHRQHHDETLLIRVTAQGANLTTQTRPAHGVSITWIHLYLEPATTIANCALPLRDSCIANRHQAKQTKKLFPPPGSRPCGWTWLRNPAHHRQALPCPPL